MKRIILAALLLSLGAAARSQVPNQDVLPVPIENEAVRLCLKAICE
jgi:hypothetical protein